MLMDHVLRVKAHIPMQGRAMASSSASFPYYGVVLKLLIPSGASYDWTCTVPCVATMMVMSNIGGMVLVVVVDSSSAKCLWSCLDCLLL